MLLRRKLYSLLFTLAILMCPYYCSAVTSIRIPILCYHNFNPTRPGSMTMSPQQFEAQLMWLRDNGFTIIPLKEAVAYLSGARATLPPKAVVMTADDGWQSQYTYLVPLVKKYHFPVTLFIYQETISHGKNTMTWNELKELQQTGLFDIEGHTYSHPNFKQAKKRMSPDVYAKFVKVELANSKQILEDKMGKKITILAWPFGIYNDYLEQAAANAGYEMALTIDYRAATRNDKPMAQPRFMIIASEPMNMFASHVNSAKTKAN